MNNILQLKQYFQSAIDSIFGKEQSEDKPNCNEWKPKQEGNITLLKRAIKAFEMKKRGGER